MDPNFKMHLPWFQRNLVQLTQSYDQDKLAHGIILSAPRGTGKRQFADYFIKSILCEKSKDSFHDYCSDCKSCHLMSAETHPDYYLLECLVDNKGVQKKSIGIDQIRNLTHKLTDKPQLSGWRIALITAISDLTTASYNALLKSLEEPGKKTLILLLADNLQTIPATIKSRCLLIQPQLNSEEITDWLIEQTNKSQEEINRALINCFNAPLKTKEYLENEGLEKELHFYQLCDQILTNQLSPAELTDLTPLSIEDQWMLLASYIHQVELSVLNNQGLVNYQYLPVKLPFQIYSKILDYQRGQFSGSNLNANLQLQAILIQWFEAGRSININKLNQ